jgi:hypothetical protein
MRRVRMSSSADVLSDGDHFLFHLILDVLGWMPRDTLCYIRYWAGRCGLRWFKRKRVRPDDDDDDDDDDVEL